MENDMGNHTSVNTSEDVYKMFVGNKALHRQQIHLNSHLNQHYFDGDLKPKNVSWVTIFANLKKETVSNNTVIAYSDTHEMKAVLQQWIINMLSSDLLDKIRNGMVLDLSLHIGPNAPVGLINQETNIN